MGGAGQIGAKRRRKRQRRYEEETMPRKETAPKLDRRKFLAAPAVAGGAGGMPAAQATTAAEAEQRLPSALPPNARVAAAETGTPELPHDNGTPGSDFMVDVIKTLDIKYLP